MREWRSKAEKQPRLIDNAKDLGLYLSENRELLKVFDPWYTIMVQWAHFSFLNISKYL